MSGAAMRAIESRLAGGEIVLLDGGVGTELERRGAPMHDAVWCAAATRSHPGLLRGIHEDYIRAGAGVIIANTFASNRIMLEPAGLGAAFEAINRGAVEAALEARERAAGAASVAVAGSMSHRLPIRGNAPVMPSSGWAADCFAEMAETLAAAGVDLIVLEMMSNPDLACPAAAAAAATGLPVWIGFSARRGARGEPVPTMRPELGLAGMIRSVDPAWAPVAGIMHTNVDLTGPALAVLRGLFDGPTLAYPDSGYFEMPNWRFSDIVPPGEFAAAAKTWIDEQGVRIVGGCCGLGVSHISALAEMIAARGPGRRAAGTAPRRTDGP